MSRLTGFAHAAYQFRELHNNTHREPGEAAIRAGEENMKSQAKTIALRGVSTAAIAFSAALISAPASAQIDEIVVTATKRSESVQSIPVAVTAFGSEELEKGRIQDLSEIADRTPSFSFQKADSTEQELIIRGIGTIRLDSASADPSVGLFIDEVYIGRRGTATPPVFDLQRVEVLRGPQGTLYGKNVVGGAVNLITARPEDTFGGALSASYGNYNAIQSDGYVTGPLANGIAGRLAFFQSSRDGYADNIMTGDELENLDQWGARGAVDVDFNERASLQLTGEWSYTENDGQSRYPVDAVSIDGPGTVRGFGGPATDDVRTSNHPFDPFEKTRTYGLTARFDYDMDWATLTYLSAWRYGNASDKFSQSGLASPPSLTDSIVGQYEEYSAYTQELRLTSNSSGPLNWIGGLYYYNETTNREDTNSATSFAFAGPGTTGDVLDGTYIYTQSAKTQNLAAFGEVNYDVTDAFTLTAGLRYTVDDKELKNKVNCLDYGAPGAIFCVAPLGPAEDQFDIQTEDDWSELTPKFAAEWRATENVFAYASATRGFKGGGWQGKPANETAALLSYNPETAWTYEAGVKTDWADGRFRFNASVFKTDFSDLQVEVLDDTGLTLVVSNAADAKINGVELETVFQPVQQLQLFGTASFLDTEYENFIDSTGRDLSGNQINRTPEFSYTVGFDFEQPVNDTYMVGARATYSWQDEFFWLPENINFEDSYGLLNGRVSFGPQDGNWEVAIWGKNVTDELYRLGIIPFAGDEFSRYGAPATYGVELSARF